MIYCLTGELLVCDPVTKTAVIDCGGVGYKVTATGNAISYLSNAVKGENVRIYTYLNIYQDGIDLYGFSSEEELNTFKRLITVSGVGPKAALSILSTLDTRALAVAIGRGDYKSIAMAPGVGSKTAQRIILELKDKFAKEFTDTGSSIPQTDTRMISGGKLADVRDTLLVLGYSSGDVARVLSKVDPDASTEEIIKQALALLLR